MCDTTEFFFSDKEVFDKARVIVSMHMIDFLADPKELKFALYKPEDASNIAKALDLAGIFKDKYHKIIY